MNLRRAIGGFILSFLFLLFFAYMISGVKWLFENPAQGADKNNFSASVSDAVENNVLPAV